MHIGQKLKKLRQLKGYTQEELSEKINKTRALLSHVEQSGKISHYTLMAILRVYGMTEDDLDRFDDSVLSTKDPGAVFFSKNDIALLKQKLANCQKENEVLKELVLSQKKVIQMMEKKKR